MLKGADPAAGFLSLNTWIDLRDRDPDPDVIDAIERAIRTGEYRTTEPSGRDIVCPYRSLYSFNEEHSAFFFGREAFIERLSQRISVPTTSSGNLVVVVGPSGSGKSSLVSAGLIPALRRRRPPSLTWDAIVFTPGAQPFHRLAEALSPGLYPDLHDPKEENIKMTSLAKAFAEGTADLSVSINQVLKQAGGTDRLLLVADQFEELFTLAEKAEQKLFVDMLLREVKQASLTVIMTLRSDFYGEAIQSSRDLSDRLEQNTVNLGPMRRDELHRAVSEPAKLVGLRFEPKLVERILDDVGEEPGHLPLLEFALSELWRKRHNGGLTDAAYSEIGEVKAAIAEYAEKWFRALPEPEQVIARQVLMRLVRVAELDTGVEDTRRRVRVSELGPEARGVVKKLADARLVVTATEREIRPETNGRGRQRGVTRSSRCRRRQSDR